MAPIETPPPHPLAPPLRAHAAGPGVETGGPGPVLTGIHVHLLHPRVDHGRLLEGGPGWRLLGAAWLATGPGAGQGCGRGRGGAPGAALLGTVVAAGAAGFWPVTRWAEADGPGPATSEGLLTEVGPWVEPPRAGSRSPALPPPPP